MSTEVDEVIVILQGGLVREAYVLKDGIQTDVSVTVHDYDIEDSIDEEGTVLGHEVLTDESGEQYVEWVVT